MTTVSAVVKQSGLQNMTRTTTSLRQHSHIGNVRENHNGPAVCLYTKTKKTLPDQRCEPHSLLITAYECSILGIKRPGRGADGLSLFLFSTDVKISGFITLLPT